MDSARGEEVGPGPGPATGTATGRPAVTGGAPGRFAASGEDVRVDPGAGTPGTTGETGRPPQREWAYVTGLTAVSLLSGLVGTALLLGRAAAGDGPLVVSPPVARTGMSTLVLVSLAWCVAASAIRDRPVALWLLRAVAVVSVLWASSASIGRSIGLVGIASVLVAHAVLVTWRPFPTSRRRQRRVAWIALVPLLLSQVVWATTAQQGATIGLLLVALGAVQIHQDGRWQLDERYDRATERLRGAAARRAGRSRRERGRRERGRTDAVRGFRLPQIDRADAAIVLVSMALMAPIWYRFSSSPSSVIGTSDFETHMGAAAELSLVPLRITAPHFGYHLPVAVLGPLFGAVTASVLVMSAGVAVTTAVLLRLGRMPFAGRPGLPPRIARVAALGYFVIESPSVIARGLGVGDPYDWATTVHAYYNPTDTLAVGFALLQVVLLAEIFRPEARLDRQAGLALAVVTAVGTMVKPSMTLVLLAAAAPMIWAARARGRRSPTRHLARYFALPGAAVLAGQTLLLAIGSSHLPPAGIAVELLATWRLLELDRAGPLLFSALLVVPICLWAGARRYLGEPMVALSLWGLLGGVAILVLFRETGQRSTDGTFAKPAFMAAAVLVVVSWRFLVGEARTWWTQRRTRTGLPGWLPAAAVFLVISLTAGTLSYLEAVGLADLPTALVR
jgi:hypothetical protein